MRLKFPEPMPRRLHLGAGHASIGRRPGGCPQPHSVSGFQRLGELSAHTGLPKLVQLLLRAGHLLAIQAGLLRLVYASPEQLYILRSHRSLDASPHICLQFQAAQGFSRTCDFCFRDIRPFGSSDSRTKPVQICGVRGFPELLSSTNSGSQASEPFPGKGDLGAREARGVGRGDRREQAALVLCLDGFRQLLCDFGPGLRHVLLGLQHVQGLSGDLNHVRILLHKGFLGLFHRCQNVLLVSGLGCQRQLALAFLADLELGMPLLELAPLWVWDTVAFQLLQSLG
mmetsp:Transcript_62562/g.149136  ORF Transcript_62562/g.149136 Transcript_62562/m.149136 type:complete len:284 (+) Transcript_62562:734-1585(+)